MTEQTTDKIQMPPELGGTVITILRKKLTRSILDAIELARSGTFDYIDKVILGYVQDPKITVEDLHAEEGIFGDIEFQMVLANKIVEVNSISGERIAELQKKTKKL